MDSRHQYYKTGSSFILSTTKKAAKKGDGAVVDPNAMQADPSVATNKPWSNWDISNDFPQKRVELLRKSTVVKRALEFRAATHVGTGIYLYKNEVAGNAKVKVPYSLPEVESFLEDNQVNSLLTGVVLDCEHYYNGMVGFTWNEPKTDIVAINRYYMANCRLQKKNPSGRIENMYLSAEWPTPKEQNFATVPLYNPIAPDKNSHFALHINYPTAEGTLYYNLSTWDVIVQNGWLDISTIVPKLKKAILENAATIKYHIEIPWSYWKMRDKDWDDKTDAEQKAIMDAKLDDINKNLFDIEASGKSLFTYFESNAESGKEYNKWTIKSIDNTINEGLLNVDSKAANSEILFAIGVAPALLGILPGATEAGSGSNIREHYSMLQTHMFFYRVQTLRILYLLKKLKKWPVDLQFGYGDLESPSAPQPIKNPT